MTITAFQPAGETKNSTGAAVELPTGGPELLCYNSSDANDLFVTFGGAGVTANAGMPIPPKGHRLITRHSTHAAHSGTGTMYYTAGHGL